MKKETAIKLFKSQANIARLLKITPQAVNSWKENIPALRAYQLKEIKNERRR